MGLEENGYGGIERSVWEGGNEEKGRRIQIVKKN
jgi:hypothetical protein